MSETTPPTPAVHPWRARLRKAVATALKRAERKREKLAAEIEACGAADAWLEAGEILKANASAFTRGETKVTLPDLYHPGQTRTIALDPYLKPMENARKYFKKARKLREGLKKKEAEAKRCREETKALAEFLHRYDAWLETSERSAAPDEPWLAEVRALRVTLPQELVGEGEAPGNAIQPSRYPGCRQYTSADGLTILVGKNSRDNDHLSLKIASGNDWWFHAGQYAGSHVVVRMAGWRPSAEKMADKKRKGDAQACPQETLLDAAHLALHFSKARGATKAEVTMAQAKQVRKRKGQPAGQVMVNGGKPVLVRIEEARLDRLLARH